MDQDNLLSLISYAPGGCTNRRSTGPPFNQNLLLKHFYRLTLIRKQPTER